MKTITTITILILTFLSSCSWLQPKYSSGLEGERLPGIDLMSKDSITVFNTKSITSGQPFVLFLYHSSCPYCNAQTVDIIKNISAFKDMSIYFISTDPYTLIRQYSSYYSLDKYPNIIMARDSASQLLDYFKAPGEPYLAFYDSNRKLKQVLLGKNDYKTIQDIITDETYNKKASIP
jgi:thioredoxin-related protein